MVPVPDWQADLGASVTMLGVVFAALHRVALRFGVRSWSERRGLVTNPHNSCPGPAVRPRTGGGARYRRRMSEYLYLAVNLRRYRVEAGLKQSELAKRAGAPFTQQYVSALERGLRPSDRAHVSILASILRVSETALLRRVRRPVGLAA
jgi:DNA-binding XRE family transcriptional regulator